MTIAKLLTSDMTLEVNVEPLKVQVFDDLKYGIHIQLCPYNTIQQLLFTIEDFIKFRKSLDMFVFSCEKKEAINFFKNHADYLKNQWSMSPEGLEYQEKFLKAIEALK